MLESQLDEAPSFLQEQLCGFKRNWSFPEFSVTNWKAVQLQRLVSSYPYTFPVARIQRLGGAADHQPYEVAVGPALLKHDCCMRSENLGDLKVLVESGCKDHQITHEQRDEGVCHSMLAPPFITH